MKLITTFLQLGVVGFIAVKFGVDYGILSMSASIYLSVRHPEKD